MQVKHRSVEGELTCICAETNDLNCIVLETTVLRYDKVTPADLKCHFVSSSEETCDLNHICFRYFPKVQMFCFY